MSMDFLLEAPIALSPVLIFLVVLIHQDGFKLVSFETILQTLLIGGVLAVMSYLANSSLMNALNISFSGYTHYLSPVIEETLKACLLVYMFARNRIGFMIDSAIVGFSVGAGFAAVENMYFLYQFPEANIGVWIIRGFGTAMMHGGTVAVFGVLAQLLTERHAKFNPLLYLPGLAAAIALHSVFNQFPGYPLLATAGAFVILPVTLLLLFSKSEHATHDWLLADYESHQHLLAEIESGDYAHTEGGRFMLDLSRSFAEAVVADMFAYIQVHTELVVDAEKILLAREEGKKPHIDPEVWKLFDRLHKLERSIGRAGMLVLWPHLHYSREELSELYELEAHFHHHVSGQAA